MSAAIPCRDALDRLSTLTSCLDVLSSLLGAAKDLHTVPADEFALLLMVLHDEQRKALRTLERHSHCSAE